MATTIDEALDIIHRTGPDLVGGNSNHGPMVPRPSWLWIVPIR